MGDGGGPVAVVDTAAIRHNVGVLRAAAGPSEVMAVVKADGYGHGMLPVATAALAAGASWLGTATVEEALTLRAAGITAPILTWLNPPGARWCDAVAAGVDVSAPHRWTLAEIVEGARRSGRPARVHLEFDSGLHRGGATEDEWASLVDAALQARSDGVLDVVGLWSHLGSSDDPRAAAARAQQERFVSACEQAENKGVRPEVRHLANSAATLVSPQSHLDLVRPGIALYGLWPDGPLCAAPLRPAMTLRARLASVRAVGADAGVSYGHEHVTRAATRLGLVACGYADGVPRCAGTSGHSTVSVRGRRRPLVGRVCMDQFVVDLGTRDDVVAGDEVVLFGPGDDGEPTATEMAGACGTIANELVTSVRGRAVRRYV